MPEYLAPGVYVEETSFRQKTIEGVSTSTAAFVGPARFGPTEGEPELLTSFADFERIYGGLDELEHGGTRTPNFLAHAVRAFFENGGSRLYVSRVYDEQTVGGRARRSVTSGGLQLTLRARYPGAAGNFEVVFEFRLGPNVLSVQDGRGVLRGAIDYDLVWVSNPDLASPPDVSLYWLQPAFDPVNRVQTYRLRRTDPDDRQERDNPLVTSLANVADLEVRVLTVSVTVGAMGRFSEPQTWPNLSFHPQHRQALTRVFAAEPFDRATALYVPLVIEAPALGSGVEVAETLLGQPVPPGAVPSSEPYATWLETLVVLEEPTPADLPRIVRVPLANGSDGDRPGAADYEGQDEQGVKSGLLVLQDLDDVSIVAAPGSTYGYSNGYRDDALTIQGQLISHSELMRYRIAVLDAPDGQLVSGIRNYRGGFDSKYAALYYPWVGILDPVTETELDLPPSGFVAGIYARNDVERGVHKAPANEVVRLALRFELMLNKAQQDVLNPEGVNCFRFFEGRGNRVWGARTITSDPEWKYVNLRRFFAYVEHSIDRGTQWAVFEPNGPLLWANVRRTVEDFLFNEWKSGHLMGDDPDEAFFVRCDRSTMTQNDFDNGRLICLIGIAPLRPAEFVIFRIGQKTLDSRG
jgi:phage tail sheath protein FI